MIAVPANYKEYIENTIKYKIFADIIEKWATLYQKIHVPCELNEAETAIYLTSDVSYSGLPSSEIEWMARSKYRKTYQEVDLCASFPMFEVMFRAQKLAKECDYERDIRISAERCELMQKILKHKVKIVKAKGWHELIFCLERMSQFLVPLSQETVQIEKEGRLTGNGFYVSIDGHDIPAVRLFFDQKIILARA